MIFAELLAAAETFGDREAIVTPTRRCTYGELVAQARRLAYDGLLLAEGRVDVDADDVQRLVAALAALDRLGAGVELRRTELLVRPPKGAQPAGEVLLLTSGTSGPAKAVAHTWESLAAAVQRRDERYHGRRWLLAYQPQSFAGLQVVLQALLTGGTLVLPDRTSASNIAACLVHEQVEMASATPTFWRTLLSSLDTSDLAHASLTQVTLGGEVADQPLLDALRAAFPAARISHVYASTEMGVCFAVHDGREGFPAAWLGDEIRACALRVAGDSELLVRSPRRMLRYAETERDSIEWFHSGDLVRIEGSRAYFAGRKSDTIHVGGEKVRPAEVEAVIRLCEDVRDVRVYGVDSSLAGQLVAAQVQVSDTANENDVRQAILSHCRRQLPKHMIPALLTFTSTALNGGDKLERETLASGR